MLLNYVLLIKRHRKVSFLNKITKIKKLKDKVLLNVWVNIKVY